MSAPRPARVLVLSASAGAGHVRAGEALEAAFREVSPGVEARHVDVLALTNRVFRHLYSKAYLDFVNALPAMMGYLYDRTDRPSRTGRSPSDRLRLAFDKLNARRFVRFLADFAPDLIVNTHFLPAEIVSNLKRRGEIAVPQAVVITDIEAHRYWAYPAVDRYCVASGEARACLTRLGVPPERISLTGIPIHPVFQKPRLRAACRQDLGLDPHLPLVLVLAGGFAIGPVDKIVEALLTVPRVLQIAVVAGRNEEMRRELAHRFQPRAARRGWRALGRPWRGAGDLPAASGSLAHLRVLGFRPDIDVWMSAADVLVSKPGGLTTAEALAKGLPLIIVNPIPGHESRNSDYLLEKGAALKASGPAMLAYKVQTLLENPAEILRLSRTAQGIARPTAARDIAQLLLADLAAAPDAARPA